MSDEKSSKKPPEKSAKKQSEKSSKKSAKESAKEPADAPIPKPPAKRSWRRRLALPVIIIGAAGLMVYYSRTKPVDITVVYDLGNNAPRASRLSVTFQREGGGSVGQPVNWEFPAGSKPLRRHRHKLNLKPGTYIVRARLSLRALGARSAEVRKVRRSIKINAGQDQRITLRFR